MMCVCVCGKVYINFIFRSCQIHNKCIYNAETNYSIYASYFWFSFVGLYIYKIVIVNILYPVYSIQHPYENGKYIYNSTNKKFKET